MEIGATIATFATFVTSDLWARPSAIEPISGYSKNDDSLSTIRVKNRLILGYEFEYKLKKMK